MVVLLVGVAVRIGAVVGQAVVAAVQTLLVISVVAFVWVVTVDVIAAVGIVTVPTVTTAGVRVAGRARTTAAPEADAVDERVAAVAAEAVVIVPYDAVAIKGSAAAATEGDTAAASSERTADATALNSWSVAAIFQGLAAERAAGRSVMPIVMRFAVVVGWPEGSAKRRKGVNRATACGCPQRRRCHLFCERPCWPPMGAAGALRRRQLFFVLGLGSDG